MRVCGLRGRGRGGWGCGVAQYTTLWSVCVCVCVCVCVEGAYEVKYMAHNLSSCNRTLYIASYLLDIDGRSWQDNFFE